MIECKKEFIGGIVMDEKKFEKLKLSYHLCFPLYVCSRLSTKNYRAYLEELNLTYTQYITMVVLWETKKSNVKDLGNKLFLDSGTLTPVLKSLEDKGYVTRKRSTEDERVLIVEITPEGEALSERAMQIPEEMTNLVRKMGLTDEEAGELSRLLYKLIGKAQEKESE